MTASSEIDFDPFPRCSGCQAPYVVRRALSLSKGWIWTWMADCRLKSCGKKHPAEIVNAAGEVQK